MNLSTNIAPVALSTSYFTGSLWEGISIITLRFSGTLSPDETLSKFKVCSYLIQIYYNTMFIIWSAK